MRFNELMTGIRQDVAVKIYGENMDTLAVIANRSRASWAKCRAQVNRRWKRSRVFHRSPSPMTGACGPIRPQHPRAEPHRAYGFSRVRPPVPSTRTSVASTWSCAWHTATAEHRRCASALRGPARRWTDPVATSGHVWNLNPARRRSAARMPSAASCRREHPRPRCGELRGGPEGRIDAEVRMPAGYYYTFGGTFENLQAPANA
jgi:hypothetical protein